MPRWTPDSRFHVTSAWAAVCDSQSAMHHAVLTPTQSQVFILEPVTGTHNKLHRAAKISFCIRIRSIAAYSLTRQQSIGRFLLHRSQPFGTVPRAANLQVVLSLSLSLTLSLSLSLSLSLLPLYLALRLSFAFKLPLPPPRAQLPAKVAPHCCNAHPLTEIPLPCRISDWWPEKVPPP